MSDVFISYAHEDRTLAQALARELEGRGFRVWWDAELVGSDDFQDVILAALAKARAAVVIWSKASVKSHFVRDEARYALHYRKLVAVKQPGLAVLDIPFGFQGQHTDDLDNREQIVRAIGKLGVAPVTAVPATGPVGTWDGVKGTRDVDALIDWLERNPMHERRQEAFQRMRLLMDADDGAAGKEKPGRIARMSNWSAFLSGLTLRMPSFQLSTQGKWTSIGFALAVVVLLLGGLAASFGLAEAVADALRRAGWNMMEARKVSVPLFGLALLLLGWFAMARYSAWLRQRNFAAAWIVAPFTALLWGLFSMFVGASVSALAGMGPVKDPFEGPILFGTMALGAVLSIAYMKRKMRSVR